MSRRSLCLLFLVLTCATSLVARGHSHHDHGEPHAHAHENGKSNDGRRSRCFGLLRPKAVPAQLPPLAKRLPAEHPWHWIQSYAAHPEVLLEAVSQSGGRQNLERKLKKIQQFDDRQFHFESKEHAEILHLFSRAAPKTKEIAAFLSNNRFGDRKMYFESIYIAVLNLMTRHLEMLLPGEDLDEIDLPRYKEILNKVIAFNPGGNPQFDLYKIERAILGRFDMKEFIECR